MYAPLILTLLPLLAQATDSPVPTVDPSVWTTPGSAIPSIELPTLDGRSTVDLASFEGKKLLLIQFASW